MFIIQFLGALAVLFGIVMLIIGPNARRKEEEYQAWKTSENRDRYRQPDRPNAFLSGFSKAKASLTIGIGVIAILLQGLFFYNPAGTVTAVQYLWGGDQIITTQGLKFKLWGKTIPISYEIAVQEIIPREDFQKEEGIYYTNSQMREFSDAIKATISTSLIVGVDFADSEQFLEMADKIRSEEKLVHARIIPVYEQALKNTCKLLDAQDYISGAASQFDYYLKDQLENGMYLTEVEEGEMKQEVIGDTSVTRTVQVMQSAGSSADSQKKFVIRRDRHGNPLRDKSTSLKRYGLTVLQAAVTGIDWEESFDKRLQLQKEQVAQTQLEKQEAEKEFYATQKAIAKGEREKAEVKVALEKKQLEQTIAAETRAKAAKFKEQEEANLLAAARKEAQRIRVTADAEAYEIAKKVSAGITPERELEMRLNAQVQMMEKLAGPEGITLPQTVFGMGNGNGRDANMLESILGAEILKGNIGK